MDGSIAKVHELVFQAGKHEDAIRLNLQDWLELVKPRIEFYSKPEHALAKRALMHRGDASIEHSARLSSAQTKDARRECASPGGGQVRVEVVGRAGV